MELKENVCAWLTATTENKRHAREMAKESKSLDDLVTEKKRTKWYIESGQMAEGSREYMQDRLILQCRRGLKNKSEKMIALL